MKRKFISFLAATAIIMLAVTLSLTGCKAAEPEAVVETVIKTVTETVIETVVSTEDPNITDPWLAEYRAKFDKYRTADQLDTNFKDAAGYPIVWDTELNITVAERDKLRAGNYKAVFMIEWGFGEWTRANTAGVQDTFDHYGIDVQMTDAEFDTQTQANQVETVVAMNPDVVIFTSVDDAASNTYAMPLVDAGIPVVLFSNIPEGWDYKTEFQSVSSQNYQSLADYSVQILADNVPENPKIGIIYYDISFGTMNVIANYVRKAIPEKIPGATVVEKGWLETPKVYDIMDALITSDPDINGAWVTCMDQATFASEACMDRERNDITITCFGVDSPTIISMLDDKPLRGAASDCPYLLGVNHAIAACAAILGKEAPPHIITPCIPITHENVEEGWILGNNEVIAPEVRVALQNYRERMGQ